MAGGTVILILVTIMILSKLVIRPVNQMAHVADLAAGGDYTVKCPSTGSRDEIGRLITSFNYMLNEVQDYHQHLEERIEEEQAKVKAAERHLLIAQRLAATGKLAAGIAHEINNPIGGMINAALNLKDRVEEDSGGGRVRVYIDLIAEGLERIKDIVRKVLVFTPRSLKPANVALISVLNDARDLLAFRLQKEEITLTLSVEPEDLMIFCEPGELRQVFLNLFINAMDAVERGSGRIEVEGRSAEEGMKVCIEVRDNGCGMDPDALSRAFDLFYSTKEVGKGTGLGLSVAQNIVMNHGGIIEAESEVGKGTKIRIVLPAR
ncbi:MAG: ATP-binding protein [Planctomycetota bacterium]|jgi:signal transduction histidine kinase